MARTDDDKARAGDDKARAGDDKARVCDDKARVRDDSRARSTGRRLHLDLHAFRDRIVGRHEIAPREARFAPMPDDLHPGLRAALAARGFERLYSHQAEMISHARAGRDVVITTGTASGKSLAFLLPVLQGILEDPSARALLVYPTKALAQDQLRGILRLADELRSAHPGLGQLESGVYDGDTPPTERKRVRERANLILTNADMLNAGLLPAHGRPGFAHLFRNVKWLVIDELHVYRGAFGAHFANLARRLDRVCRHYGSRPQILASSATIANPKELAERLTGRSFEWVREDGSPAAGKTVYFWQPPLMDNDVRRSTVAELVTLFPRLIEQRARTIAFCKSRKETEVTLKEIRDRLSRVDGSHDESRLVSAYRGGYTPAERRRIERDLIEGRLLGVVSTNALELGIDIGQLEVVVQAGFPGTRASFWQQLGRAGRRGRHASAILILAQTPVDQYIAQDPDWLVGQETEHAVVDPDNLSVQLAHVRCAAAELPLTLDDVARFPDLGEVLAVLQEAGEVREVAGSFHWTGGPFPAGDFSLRNGDPDRFKVTNRLTGQTLTEMTRPQVYREAHTRAVYLHDGMQYLVEELDLVGHRAVIVPVDQNFYTEPDVRTHIDVLNTQETQAVGRIVATFGDVRVDESVVGYKMLQFHNHQNLGYEMLHEPLRMRLETEGLWLPVPEDVLAVLGGERTDALRGMVHAIRAVARMTTMAEKSDLQGTSFRYTEPETGATRTALICYDSHPGGIGFAAKALDHAEAIVQGAQLLVDRCRCKRGCPACVGDFAIDRRLIQWGLAGLFAAMVPPAFAAARASTAASRASRASRGRASRQAVTPVEERRFGWDDLAGTWPEVRAFLEATGEHGTTFLASIEAVVTRGDKLILYVGSPQVADWLGRDPTKKQLRNLLVHHLRMPERWRLSAEVAEARRDEALRRELKLRRRFEDLHAEDSADERDANDKLGGGYLVPGDGVVN